MTLLRILAELEFWCVIFKVMLLLWHSHIDLKANAENVSQCIEGDIRWCPRNYWNC